MGNNCTLSLIFGDKPAGFVACNSCNEIESLGHPMSFEEVWFAMEEFSRGHKECE